MYLCYDASPGPAARECDAKKLTKIFHPRLAAETASGRMAAKEARLIFHDNKIY